MTRLPDTGKSLLRERSNKEHNHVENNRHPHVVPWNCIRHIPLSLSFYSPRLFLFFFFFFFHSIKESNSRSAPKERREGGCPFHLWISHSTLPWTMLSPFLRGARVPGFPFFRLLLPAQEGNCGLTFFTVSGRKVAGWPYHHSTRGEKKRERNV